MASANVMIYFLVILLSISGISAISSKEFEIVGPCIKNECPLSYTCNRDKCIREKPNPFTGAGAIGPCVYSQTTHTNQCPVGYSCKENDVQLRQCYPTA